MAENNNNQVGWLASLGSPRRVFINLALLAAGSLFVAWGVVGILVPQEFVNGGVMGLILILYKLWPDLPLSAAYFLLNIPIFGLGWRLVGRRFLLYSLAGSVIMSATLALPWPLIPVHEALPAALLAGILSGVGGGLILRSHGSAGGTDILAVIFLRAFTIRLGSTTLAMNFVVIGLAAFFFDLDRILYTLVFLYVTAEVLNLVVTGLSQRKAVLIISNHWQELADMILKERRRGATLIPAKGAFSGQEAKMIYTVVAFRDLGPLKRRVLEVDPEAMVVVTDTLEVVGQRIGNQPHW